MNPPGVLELASTGHQAHAPISPAGTTVASGTASGNALHPPPQLGRKARRGIENGAEHYKFVSLCDIHGPRPYEFAWLGDVLGPKLYKFVWFEGAFSKAVAYV